MNLIYALTHLVMTICLMSVLYMGVGEKILVKHQ